MQEFFAEEEKRLDLLLADFFHISRAQAQKMIQTQEVFIDGTLAKKSGQLVKKGAKVQTKPYEEPVMDVKKENIPLDIVYEDDEVVVINKPKKMVVHPAPGNYEGTLVNALLYHFQNLSDVNGSTRPGIVHRIDADTTGLLMIAKNNKAHEFLAKELEEKKTKRKYIALVHGVISPDTGTIDAPIGRDPKDRKKMAVVENGKNAITHFKVLERYKRATLIELVLETGRTHQIRVHMQYIGHPVVNDPVYSTHKVLDDSGQCLHAKELGFHHPKTKEEMHFTCDLPESFIKILNLYKNE